MWNRWFHGILLSLEKKIVKKHSVFLVHVLNVLNSWNIWKRRWYLSCWISHFISCSITFTEKCVNSWNPLSFILQPDLFQIFPWNHCTMRKWLWLLDHPWKSLKIGYFTVFLPFIWPILVPYAHKMTKIAKKIMSGYENYAWKPNKLQFVHFFKFRVILV